MMANKNVGGYFYILASGQYKTLYVGVTNNIARRMAEHKSGKSSSFAKKYDVTSLAYYEVYESIEDAISREKKVKKWERNWKLDLIESMNPDWRDLYEDVVKQ